MNLARVDRLLNATRRVLAGPGPSGSEQVCSRQSQAYRRASVLVRMFYLLSFVLACGDAHAVLMRARVQQWDPLWPLFWLEYIEPNRVVGQCFAAGLILAAMLAAICPRPRWTRGLVFLALFLFCAFENSFGKIAHSRFCLMLISGIFVGLPAIVRGERASRLERQRYVLVFGGGQALFLLTYSMAGIGKLLAAGVQMMAGDIHVFSPTALSLHIAARLLQTNESSVLGAWMIAHPGVGQAAMLVTLYLQTFAFVAAFRPACHFGWAVGLMGFHVMSELTMGIGFWPNVILLALLFFWSPFRGAPGGSPSWPLWGDLWSWLRGGKNVSARPRVDSAHGRHVRAALAARH